MNTEENILNQALEKFYSATGIKITGKKPDSRNGDSLLQFAWNKIKYKFSAEVKNNLNTAIIGKVRADVQNRSYPLVLVTSYVSSQLAETLRNLNLNFLDTAGNAFISHPPLFIFMKGNKPEALPIKTKRLYQTSGLKIIFSLLCNPGLENMDYRKIAQFSGVALGSIAWVIRDLKMSGFIIEESKNLRKLINKGVLLNNWVINYQEQLKPKLLIGIYNPLETTWYENAFMQEEFLWGSEFAAQKMTKYLKPEMIAIYSKELTPDFLLKNKLHRTNDGTVIVYKKFWNFTDQWTDKYLVPPLLVYADLIGSSSARNIETAKIIYEKELTQLIR